MLGRGVAEQVRGTRVIGRGWARWDKGGLARQERDILAVRRGTLGWGVTGQARSTATIGRGPPGWDRHSMRRRDADGRCRGTAASGHGRGFAAMECGLPGWYRCGVAFLRLDAITAGLCMLKPGTAAQARSSAAGGRGRSFAALEYDLPGWDQHDITSPRCDAIAIAAAGRGMVRWDGLRHGPGTMAIEHGSVRRDMCGIARHRRDMLVVGHGWYGRGVSRHCRGAAAIGRGPPG